MKNKLFISSLFLLFNLSCMDKDYDCKKCQLEGIDHKIDNAKMLEILQCANEPTKLAILCHKLTKEEVLLKEKKSNFLKEAWRRSDSSSLLLICPSSYSFFEKLGNTLGLPSKKGCYDPTPREIIKRKVENGCKAEGCLYLYNKIRAEEDKDERERKLADQIAKQDYQKMVEEFKRN